MAPAFPLDAGADPSSRQNSAQGVACVEAILNTNLLGRHPRFAPSASRIPNSFVLCTTVHDTTL